MKNFKTVLLIAGLTLITSLYSCKPDEGDDPKPENPFAELVELSKTYSGTGLYTKLYASEALFVGYNTIYVAVFDSTTDEQLSNGEVLFNPMMDMMTMKHSAPHEDPGSTIDEKTKAFKGAVVFIMPSGMHGTWALNLSLLDFAGHSTVDISIPVDISQKAEPRVRSFVSSIDSSSIFVTLIEPTDPEVGLNDITFGVYKRENMMNFPPIEDVNIEFDPQMLSMGHGSPNNVNPVHMANGVYKGTVNFTMTGKWTIFTLLKNQQGSALGDTLSFDMTLK